MADYGLLSIVPAVLALILAFTTRHVVLALGVAVISGMLILTKGHPVDTALMFLSDGPFTQLASGSNAQIIIVITIISGFIYLVEQSGGMAAFSTMATRYVSSPLKAQLATWATGIGVFFTDSGNSLILGPMFSPIYNKLKLSKEKLAFIIDSTSSPICVLIPIISWGVYSQGLIENAFDNMGQPVDGFATFLQVIPYQLYALLALFSVPVYAVLKKDWGPMAEVERQARQQAEVSVQSADDQQVKSGRISLIVLPLAVLFGSLIALFTYNYHLHGTINGPVIRASLGTSYLIASVTAIAYYAYTKTMTASTAFNTFVSGMQRIMLILVILLLAWTLGDICKSLGTGDYISQVMNDRLPVFMLPALIFIIGSFISVATGSSWGTFAILIPIAVPVASALGADPLICIGAALSGGMLGDHSSPISDTTILSSMSTGCDHVSHVRTQFPYAILTGVTASIGFMVAEITRSPYTIVLAAVLQVALIVLMVRRQAAATPVTA
ncbi:Na+/H+ antiporter NhaC family protein [Photobacterium rosenbergii]|uniref:Na+/H+ antiporter NhaC family protein n=1 Tax=Photobacterium rosenbergii TaxID=294936 RepID=A0ABU3ZIB9_9GAMM|nr:Na+/H+ antiporter NhaC family protein [Photobacterium rosenbergii]MDV5169795.1 Na+/H+ antiporter NhaC family protein [Photobacterium rosenbergii]